MLYKFKYKAFRKSEIFDFLIFIDEGAAYSIRRYNINYPIYLNSRTFINKNQYLINNKIL